VVAVSGYHKAVRRFALLILVLTGQLPTIAWAQARPTVSDKGGAGEKCGPLSDHQFKCAKFGFTVRVPFGWVERTDTIGGPGERNDQESQQPAEASGSRVLLAVFAHPPEVVGNTINSAIVIAVESLANCPQVKSAADYFGPLTDLAEQRGFAADGGPYVFEVGGRPLIRGDFKREQGPVAMWQSSLVMIEKHSIVSFTFIAGSDQETDELIEQLSFLPSKRK
jgi:hypothetical protein